VIRLVLFDIDGTLVTTGGAGVRAFERVLATQFGVPGGIDGVRFAGRTDSSLVHEIFRKHRIEVAPETVARFFDAYYFWLDHLLERSNGGPLPGARDWLEALAGLPHRPAVGLLTGNVRLGAEIKLRHYGLWDHFQTGGFGDDDLDRNRIAVAARRRGEELLGGRLKDSEVLVVGDTPLDIACGRHAGARTLAVATGPHSLAELAAHQPDWVAADLRQASVRRICGGED